MSDLLGKIRLTTAHESAMIEQANKPAPVMPRTIRPADQRTARSIAQRAARTRGLAGWIKTALEPSRTVRKSWKVSDPRTRAAVETQVYFDVMAAHAITPLDLERLHAMTAPAFKQEIRGIMTHLDRHAALFRNDYRPTTALEGNQR